MKIGITQSETNYANYPRWIRGTIREDSFVHRTPFRGEGVDIIELSYDHNNFSDVALCDGVVLTGGIDSHPQFYLDNYDLDYPHAPDEFAVHRDEFEFAVLREAIKHKKPILGICRGLQLINIFFGGTLHLDIGEDNNTTHKKTEGIDKEHAILVDTHSMFFDITQQERGIVNSAHHQAIEKLAKDLKASAISDDNFIEAIELADSKQQFLLAVQWHPERMLDTENPFTKNIRQAFLDKCKNSVYVK